jgi:hypothetical protein
MRFLSQALAWTLLVMMVLGSKGPAGAEQESQSLFDVLDVDVDVTEATAASARAKALAEAERRAFDIVLARVTLPEDRERASFNDAEIARLTRHFWISDEKRSSVRYIATVNYSFRPDRVRQFLAARGVPMVEKQSPPVLVLPVYQTNSGSVLWQRPNPWWDAWSAKSDPGLVPTVLPSGDATDAGTISLDEALAADSEKLSALAQRYGLNMVLVTALRMAAQDSTPILTLIQWENDKEVYKWSGDPQVENNDNKNADAIMHAKGVVLASIENNWKRRNLSKRYNLSSFPVNVRVSGLKSWQSIERRLKNTDGIAEVTVLSMSQQEVLAHISHHRAPEELSTSLMASNLYLFRDENMGWVLDTSKPPSALVNESAASAPDAPAHERYNMPVRERFSVPGGAPPGSM